MSIKSNITKAIVQSKQKALSYIFSSRSKDGYWRDFNTHSSGVSTDWITSYVIFSLSKVININKSIKESLEKLKYSGEKRLGWGFSSRVPPDCDSTATALLALSLLSEKTKNMTDHFNFLIRHQDLKTGGFSTFINGDELRLYRKNRDENFSGWLIPHTCVTALAIRALRYYKGNNKNIILEKAIVYLADRQSNEGFWESYWWRTKYYSTFHILAGLSENKQLLSFPNLSHTFKWIYETKNKNGFWQNGFTPGACFISTILALNSLIVLKSIYKIPFKDTFMRSLEWILDLQKNDGYWESSPFFQIPPPDVTNPSTFKNWSKKKYGTGSCTNDSNRIYTTASTVNFLENLLKEY